MVQKDEAQLSLFGKTYQELLAPTEEKISAPCLKSSSKSRSRQPLCLTFRKADGHTPTVGGVTDGALLTEFLTRNTSERLNGESGYTLSSVLETRTGLEKYYLSATACEGIIRRAENRGKELPSLLKEALMQVIKREQLSEREVSEH